VSTENISTSQELPADECWELLRQSPVGRLAVVVAGDPDIFPINYVVDHGSIVIRTAAGTKLATCAADSREKLLVTVDQRRVERTTREAWRSPAAVLQDYRRV
jgi:nitroimidazol reductase NimA-like FMN-containing flavoprotein (pyridoxamine 5'-phosphate oxidase superfamily)